MENIIRANMIVDLYEVRASTFVPFRPGERKIEKVENVFKYNFFDAVIAQISDKYQIPYEVIEDIIRERSLMESSLKPPLTL